ncbi:separin [Scaptodrosophila lebanonensis]|uniref:separase n=1 Tax=Drosophila lebanonensis TaxID=7225 RepID=A0A6J2TAS3_DROLE|nr:separin [Scaptodrosophila lebanonensis]
MAEANAQNGDVMMNNMCSTQVGPEAKEFNLLRADEEYRNGNVEHSIYYQVRAQFHCWDTRYLTEWEDVENCLPSCKTILNECSAAEKAAFKSNKPLLNILNYLKNSELKEETQTKPTKVMENLDFLESIVEPALGIKRIIEVCSQLPNEWCVLQLCKSFNTATTYSGFGEIFGADGAVYLSLLRHCRSPELGPVCVRINNENLAEIFSSYSTIVERFRRIINVDVKKYKSQETKAKYWQDLNAFEEFLHSLLEKLRNCMLPYGFLFFGKRYDCEAVQTQTLAVIQSVDALCDKYGWSIHQRIILSQAAMHANNLSQAEISMACYELAANNELECQSIYNLLKTCAKDWQRIERQQPLSSRRFPTIMVVDERLDHIHWEQLKPTQEFTRIKSLHSLWRLYKFHKPSIRHGYLVVNVQRGMCVINPDGDLPNSGRRLRGFFEHWLPQWRHLFEVVPTEETVVSEAYNADCFVYAGHGSGLQYISAKKICRTRVKGVVFLFGCDSTRLLGTGLYSALYGTHNYYHGALCPTVMGTLMPALDANMDTVSVSVLSRWLAPGKPDVIPWTHINRSAWLTKGEVKGDDLETLERHPDYQMGSLCAIVSFVHQGLVEPKLYNSCVYVCRGLPAWNVAVKELPF